MTDQEKLALKKNRLNTITAKGKTTQGVIRKLEREIRNAKK